MDIVLVLIFLVVGAPVYMLFFSKSKPTTEHNKQKSLSPQLKELHSQCEKEEDRGIKISELYFYPVRGMKGTRVKQAHILDGRIMFDREWVLKDPATPTTEYKHLTLARSEIPGRFQPHLDHDERTGRTTLRFEYPGKQDLVLNVTPRPDPTGKELIKVCVFTREVCNAYSEGPEAAKWFSDIAGSPLILIRNLENVPVMPEKQKQELELLSYDDDRK